MGVGATEAETGDASHRLTGVARPLTVLSDGLQVVALEVDVRVGAGEVQHGRNDALFHSQRQLNEGGGASGRLHVAKVSLTGAQQQRLLFVAAVAQHLAQGEGFDGVAQNSAGAVCLHIVHVLRGDVGVVVGIHQHLHLRIRVGGSDAVRAAILVDSRTLDDGVNVVAVSLRILESLQQNQAGAVRAGNAVGVVGESLDVAVRGEHRL